MRIYLLSAALLLGGCLQIDATPGKFRCDQPGDACPAGLACVAGLCQSRGDETGGVADLASATVDGPGAAAGCAGAGSLLQRSGAAEVYACQGRFGAGQQASLCAAGSHVCGTADEALLAAVATEGRCDGLRGFFAAQVEGALSGDGALACRAAQPPERALLLGCGADEGVTQPAGASCRGLRAALSCAAAPSGWSCTSRLQDAAHSGDRGGVLCCKG